MVLRIFQISDIHIGGEYGGKFDCWGNFEKTVNEIVTRYANFGHRNMALFGDIFPQSILVLSGDICDRDTDSATVENYKKIKDFIDSKMFFSHILAIPGNHDDPAALSEVFGGNPENCRSLISDYANLVFIPTYSGTVNTEAVTGDIVTWLSGLPDDMKNRQTLVFSHYPVGPLHHRFMSGKYSLKNGEDLAKALEYIGVTDTFCGHYHSGGSYSVNPRYRIHVSPSTQMQLNPYSKSCDTVADYPGYQVIELLDEHRIKVKQEYLDGSDEPKHMDTEKL